MIKVTNLAILISLYMRMNDIDFRSFAKEIDITSSTLNRYVNGKSQLSVENYLKIQQWLNTNSKVNKV